MTIEADIIRPKSKKDHEITLVVFKIYYLSGGRKEQQVVLSLGFYPLREPSELNKVTLKRVGWKEPAAGHGVISTASCQNVFVYICSNL